MDELVLEHISKRFGKKQALKDVSCSFAPGITALLGPNGAGKSTLMNIVCTLLKADTGSITYGGKNIWANKKEYCAELAMLFQNQPMYRSDNAMEYLYFCGGLKGMGKEEVRQQGEALLHRFGIADTGKKRIAAFSGGMRQRLAICGVLLGKPKILMLDEPSAGLDIFEREELKRTLCALKQECTVIISTHIVPDVENISDRILLLKDGQICASGTQQELIDGISGGVWELPQDAPKEIESYFSDGRRLTISGQSPCSGAVKKEADLTDVYFSHIKGR